MKVDIASVEALLRLVSRIATLRDCLNEAIKCAPSPATDEILGQVGAFKLVAKSLDDLLNDKCPNLLKPEMDYLYYPEWEIPKEEKDS